MSEKRIYEVKYVERLEVMHKNRGTMIAERDAEIERLWALCEAMLKTENDAVTWRRFKIDELQAELKQANAALTEIASTDDFGNQWAADTAREALAALETTGRPVDPESDPDSAG